MTSFLARDQKPERYDAPTAEDLAYAQRLISLNFYAGKYEVRIGAGLEEQVVESGPVAPEVVGDSREERKARMSWMNALIERIRAKAIADKMLFQVGEGWFSSWERKDYRK